MFPGKAVSAAWETLYHTYHRLIVTEAERHGLPAIDVPVVVQQTWLALIQHLPEFEAEDLPDRLRDWVNQVVLSKAMDVHRRRRRQPARSVDDLRGGSQEPAAPADDAEEREEDQRRLERIWEAVDRLPGGRDGINARIVVLYYRGGKELVEIAAVVQKTPGQVKARLYRARLALRRMLGVDPQPPPRRAARRKGRES